MALASDFRIKGSRRIEEVKTKGRIFQSDSFGIAYLDRGDQDFSKFAFVTSKKISKLSVHRNRVSRALSEGVRRNTSRIPRGYDFVFLTKRDITTKSTEDILMEIDKFFFDFKPKK